MENGTAPRIGVLDPPLARPLHHLLACTVLVFLGLTFSTAAIMAILGARHAQAATDVHRALDELDPCWTDGSMVMPAPSDEEPVVAGDLQHAHVAERLPRRTKPSSFARMAEVRPWCRAGPSAGSRPDPARASVPPPQPPPRAWHVQDLDGSIERPTLRATPSMSERWPWVPPPDDPFLPGHHEERPSSFSAHGTTTRPGPPAGALESE